MVHRKFFLSMSIALFLLAGLAGCSDPMSTPPAPFEVHDKDYGSGVYVVPFGQNAPKTVAAFITKHPDLRITSIYAADEGTHGWTRSLMLVTEKK